MHWLSFPPEFQSTPLMRGETLQLSDRMHGRRKFQSTPLMRGETWPSLAACPITPISIQSPHARGDPGEGKYSGTCAISIHSPHARGDLPIYITSIDTNISIHSPHARGDSRHRRSRRFLCAFQSTPLMRGETGTKDRCDRREPFQSTPLMRGETKAASAEKRRNNFNPLPSCEGRHERVARPVGIIGISIHSPHARGDRACQRLRPGFVISIHSPHARGDVCLIPTAYIDGISIHSPHARGDRN